jgi:hypothetical protein
LHHDGTDLEIVEAETWQDALHMVIDCIELDKEGYPIDEDGKRYEDWEDEEPYTDEDF